MCVCNRKSQQIKSYTKEKLSRMEQRARQRTSRQFITTSKMKAPSITVRIVLTFAVYIHRIVHLTDSHADERFSASAIFRNESGNVVAQSTEHEAIFPAAPVIIRDVRHAGWSLIMRKSDINASPFFPVSIQVQLLAESFL